MSKKWLILGSVSFGVGLSLNLIINRDIKQAALTGLLSVPATAAGVSVIEHQRRRKLNDKISTQQKQLQGLVQQKTDSNNSITLLSKQVESLKQQEKDIKTAISSLSTNQQQSKSAFVTLQNDIRELSDRKLNLEPEIATLEAKLRHLKEKETALTELSAKISNLEQQKLDLEKAIAIITSDQQELIAETNNLQSDNESLRQQINDSKKNHHNLQNTAIELDNALSIKQQQLQELEQKESSLLKSLENLSKTQIDLDSKLESDLKASERLKQEKLDLERQFVRTQQQINNEVAALRQNVFSLETQKNSAVQELAEVEAKKEQAQVNLNKEQHKLASIKKQINEQEDDQLKLENILSALNAKLSNLPSYIDELEAEIERLINHKNEINFNLDNPEQAEVKIEFDFDKLQDTVIKTDLIIQRLQIVRDIADKHDWWEIAHSSALDVAEALYRCWEKKYRNWGTIRHFLNIDKIDEQTETIPERLVKNIAIVAIELEYQGITHEQLQKDEVKNKIYEILHDSNLNISNSFFLRDWSDLITVLTPRKDKGDRKTLKRRNQPPYLYLDITDTLNIQLILPEQSLWEQEWQNLRGTYCQISEAEWNSSIPNEDNLEIPELEINITKAAEQWTYYLQDHNRNQIYQWKHQGINSEFPCLVFDAMSGGRINIDISKPEIVNVEEIILFTSREVEIELDSNIELIDSFVTSSIKEWRGKKVRLLESEALIQIKNLKINWKLQELEPRLIGLRLKGRKLVYLNPPTLYYPPQKEDITINCLIESMDKKEIIARNSLQLSADNNWSEIDLSQCITDAGKYQATFWHKEKQWSYLFAVQQEYELTQYLGCRNLKIYDYHNNLLSTPIKYDDLSKFGGEKITINNLYPLEELIFRFKSDSEQYIFHLQADSSGKLTLLLTTLEHRLSKCDRYYLDFKQSGAEFKSILQVGYPVTDKPTETEVIVEESPSKGNLLISQSANKQEQKSNIENTNQITSGSEQWCLVTVHQWKRKTFLKYLDNDIQRNQLQELMLEINAPEESVYQDMILIQIGDYSEARNYLQKIEHFQSIKRIKPEDVDRMLNS